jgi:GT2 family glycosyltransferase
MGKIINIMIDVSIIIVSYNNFDLLKYCLFTLFKFSKEFVFEVIIVDNNSSEGNIDDIVKEFDNIILIKNQTNLGFSKANNIGLNIAKGKYILFLNNDVYFFENSIKRVLDYARTQSANTFIGCKLLNTDNSWQASTANFPSGLNSFSANFFLYLFFPNSKTLNKYFLQEREVREPVIVDYVLGAFLFGERETLLKLKGFDDRFFFYAEDMDLCYRLKLIDGKTIFYPLASVIHVGGASVKANQWFKFKNKALSELQFFQKHRGGIELFIGVLSHFLGNLVRIPIFALIGIIKFDKNLITRSFYHFRLLFVYPKNVF